jgi:site-specific DNA-methyltransferase (adenine-specific)
MTFGFRTFFKDFDSLKPKNGFIKVYANKQIGFIARQRIPKGHEFIDKWKIFIPEAVGSGNSETDILRPILGAPGSISTETYIMNGPYKNKKEALNAMSYIKTKFFHFLLGLKKITQHTSQAFYQLIPMQDFSMSWTDTKLYKKYKLTQKEIDFIESTIKTMK